MQIGVIGSGSWATALAKIITDNKHPIHWWIRQSSLVEQLQKRRQNPQYLPSVRFDLSLLQLTTEIKQVVQQADLIVLAVPSAYLASSLEGLTPKDWKGKKVLSAIKGLLPDQNILVNHYLQNEFGVELSDYFTVMGPCHAEEVAAEKLSYLTFSGLDTSTTKDIAQAFSSSYLRTVVNNDIYGVQYAAILKNIYALGAGIAHGLEYGDNFLSVLIANSADEMAGFLRKAGIINAEMGYIEHHKPESQPTHNNYGASVYMGDLLVTCYSLYSRNRTFGAMIGKGYSVKAAQLEMSMVAEGYNASKCMYLINKNIEAEMPIAEAVYKILWQNESPLSAFKAIEEVLV